MFVTFVCHPYPNRKNKFPTKLVLGLDGTKIGENGVQYRAQCIEKK